MHMNTLIIIPAYNEAANIVKVVESLSSLKNQVDYVIVNDGSRDQTASICMEKGYPLINLPVNVGLAGAFQAGVKYALRNGYDSVLQFDGDGQHNAIFVDKMINRLEACGCDIVIGSRFVQEKRPKSLRMLGNGLIQFAIAVTTKRKITDPTSGMRLYNQKVLGILGESADLSPEPDTIAFLARSGASIEELHITMNERLAGKSYLTFSRSIRYMMHMCLSIFFIQWFRKKLTIS